MEEKKIENTEEKPKMNENSQNQAEKKKMPVALKRILAIVACLMILIGGGNVYATSQGYNNIFFLIIDKLGISKDVSGKDNILSDRDITISYRSIEISEGTLIQINSLVIKDNEAKLKIHVDEKNAKKIITPLTYKVRDENDVELCNYTSVHSQTHTDFKEKLILNNYKNDTKKLILEIYDLNMEKIVELEIDLEKKKINVIGNAEEVTKISEEELKKYLGAFAMLNYNGTEYRDFSKNTVEVENTKKVIAALEIAKIKNINVYTGEKEMHEMEYNLVIDKEKVNNLVQSFTTVELNKEGLIPLDPTGEYLYYPGKINGKNVYIDGDRVRFSPTCLEITDIAYIGGIYNVTFKFCYSLEENKGFETTDTVEKLPVYEMSVGLILDEDSEYSKYRVSSMSEATLVEKGTGENSNETINNAQAQEIIQGFINIISRHEASTTSMLTIEEISLVTQEELTQIYNTAKRDEEGYMKTNIKYSDLKNKMLEYMTEELFETYSYGYKNVDGNLWVLDGGASGYSKKVESIKIISSSENKLTYEVVTLIGTFDEMTESRNEKYELQKHENGRYVVSSWGWHIELKETLQNYLNLSGAYEGSPKALLEKLNLLKTGDISYTNEKADGEGYIKTNIKYSDYKEAMLNYVSENLFNEKFTSLYKEKDGYLYYYDGGGTGMQFEVENVILKDGKYVGIIYDTTWKDETGSKGEKQYKEFGVEEHNGKRVISYYN